MSKYIFTFMASGSITIEAEDMREAQELFNKKTNEELFETLESNSVEQTDCFEEED